MVRWDGTAGETGEELFYGVSDYEVESDGSVTLLSGYGDAKELWYYSVSGGRRLLDSAALGFSTQRIRSHGKQIKYKKSIRCESDAFLVLLFLCK